MKIHRVIGVLAALAATTMLVGAFAPSADARVDSVAIAEQTSDGLDFASKTPTDDPYTAETVVTCNSSSEEDNFCDNLADACAASGGGGSSEPGGGETCSIRDDAEVKQVKHTPLLTRISP